MTVMPRVDEEEIESLISGGGGGAVVVVEYLQSSMSRELLCKFPDNSAFDFDYSQSSIWSPLVPRPFPSYLLHDNGLSIMAMEVMGISSSSSFSSSEVQRKLLYDEENTNNTTLKKLTANIKKKITTTVFDNLHIYHNTKTKKRMGFDFSPNTAAPFKATSTPTPRKGWAKVLKAATKHFKKTTKKKDSRAHLKLSDCLTYAKF